MREIAEGANDRYGLAGAQPLEQGIELAAGLSVGVALRADAETPDGFDQSKYRFTFLLANGVAENLPKQADVIDQRLVRVFRGRDTRGGRFDHRHVSL